MRAAALALVLAGCTSAPEVLRVSVSPSRVEISLLEATCTCEDAPLAIDECIEISDAKVAGYCGTCESQCDDVSAVRADDPSMLRVSGCGRAADVSIPTDFPAVPQIALEDASLGHLAVRWQADASTVSVLVNGGGYYVGKRCRDPVALGRRELPVQRFQGNGVAVIAERETTSTQTSFGETLVTAHSERVFIDLSP